MDRIKRAISSVLAVAIAAVLCAGCSRKFTCSSIGKDYDR